MPLWISSGRSATRPAHNPRHRCLSPTPAPIAGLVLTPGRYVGIPDEEDDGIPFEEKMNTLTSELKSLMEKGKELDNEIKNQLGKIGYEI